MDIFDSKSESDQIRKMFKKSQRNTISNQPQIDIDNLVNNLISEYEQNQLDVSLIDSKYLINICKYYSNQEISHNFDIILQKQEFIDILISFIRNLGEDIPYHSLLIIEALIINNQDLLIIFIEHNLYSLLTSILEEIDRFGKYCYKEIMNILRIIFSFKNEANIKMFMDSSLLETFLSLLKSFGEVIFTDDESQYMLDRYVAKSKLFQFNKDELKRKYSEIFTDQEEEEIFYRASFDESIIYLVGKAYLFCGNEIDDYTSQFLNAMMNLMGTANKNFLSYSISTSIYNMMVSSQNAQTLFFDTGLAKYLNELLNSTDYRIVWPSILRADAYALKCLPKHDTDESNYEILDIINPISLYTILSNIKETEDLKESDYQQKSFAQVLDVYTVLCNLGFQIINENDTKQTKCITLDQFLTILTLFDNFDGTLFKVFEIIFNFIFSVINTQECFRTHIDIIDDIFGKYADSIINYLGNCTSAPLKTALLVLNELAASEIKGENIQNLLFSTKLQLLLEKWQDDEDDEIIHLSQNLLPSFDA